MEVVRSKVVRHRSSTTPLFALPAIEAIEVVRFLGAVCHVSENVVPVPNA